MPPKVPLWGRGSPSEGSGLPLERADDLVGDPTAVEAAGLRPHRLAVDGRRVDPAGVEGDRTAQQLEPEGRFLVAPRHRGTADAVDDGVPVGRRPLELAPRRAGSALQHAGCEVVPGHVVDRWVAGLADPDRAVGAGDDPAIEDDLYPPSGHLRRGRPGVAPDGLLPRADRV